MTSFKQKYTLAERIEKFQKQQVNHPQKAILIIEKHQDSILPDLSNSRFLCDRSFQFQKTIAMLKSKILSNLSADQKLLFKDIHFFVNGKLITNLRQRVEQIEQRFKDEDGCIYLIYSEKIPTFLLPKLFKIGWQSLNSLLNKLRLRKKPTEKLMQAPESEQTSNMINTIIIAQKDGKTEKFKLVLSRQSTITQNWENIYCQLVLNYVGWSPPTPEHCIVIDEQNDKKLPFNVKLGELFGQKCSNRVLTILPNPRSGSVQQSNFITLTLTLSGQDRVTTKKLKVFNLTSLKQNRLNVVQLFLNQVKEISLNEEDIQFEDLEQGTQIENIEESLVDLFGIQCKQKHLRVGIKIQRLMRMMKQEQKEDHSEKAAQNEKAE